MVSGGCRSPPRPCRPYRQPDASARHRRLADPRQDRHGLQFSPQDLLDGSLSQASSRIGWFVAIWAANGQDARKSSSTPVIRSRANRRRRPPPGPGGEVPPPCRPGRTGWQTFRRQGRRLLLCLLLCWMIPGHANGDPGRRLGAQHQAQIYHSLRLWALPGIRQGWPTSLA